MNDDVPSAHQIVAFGIVELNTPLPLEHLYAMSPTDPLYQALVKAWKARERRLDYRTGLVCAILCNVMGSGKKQFNAEDFMPVEPISREDEERALKANLAAYSIAQSKISK